ncbi:DUF2157 domain-containing protein [Fictibacillus phosphorivorans]|uniref:DUF2157 domain-containing protein n=1 Tax=Fictibacillus phosphorivorans TaxID=1221500 RepID=UPI00203E4693|nr:DUF2157 domain-containing protein [Fictibacillus phosphorivorans]MCM3717527.1 DUF2157 domain-containing protein [Fictibacillus phosphorivorans]MCM3775222.1 DUF2157 domain-containing protein [Fictibacillus phosphorivorans]
MNQKWMRHEGQKWVEEKIITPDQLEQIVARYPDSKEIRKPAGILPVLASILIGVGILSFIASNWSEISPLARLGLLLLIMISFYTVGDMYLKKGNETLGTSLNLLGIVSFGASIILLGQTFHLTATDARLFVFWSLPALFYLFRDRHKLYIFFLAVLTIGGQLYSMGEFDSFSYFLFAIFLISIGGFVYLYPRTLEIWLFTIGLSIQAFLFVIIEDLNLLWFFLFGFALYTASMWINRTLFKRSFKRVGSLIGFAYAYGLYFTLTNEFLADLEFPNAALFLPPLILIFVLAALKKRNGSTNPPSWELLIFIPYFYLAKVADPLLTGLLYLVVMFAYSGFMLADGYKKESRSQINLGIVLFLLVCLMGYFNLAWAFMPKSVFFLIGGILLFILNAFLQRKKKQILKNGGPHDE